MNGSSRVVVIGVGNSMRRDDGAGPAAVERARGRLPDGVCVVECAGDPVELLDRWDGADLAVLVDAGRWPGAAPGQIAWFSDAAHKPDGPLTAVGNLGTHGLAVPEVLELGQALGRLPRRLDVLVVALDDSGFGIGFSPGVEAGVDRAAEMLVDQVRSFADGAAVASREA